ncbi:hypothetical protein [Paenibacillus sp. Y412MC10]|uniref:hypothetical protein n=1 Tax=Geobacillus sp. (strain Y412MC10) TaxID=481743 RepID=UPI0011A5B3FE|nr:hypothetical protein [Paenibacillus sp. Y412MC10]
MAAVEGHWGDKPPTENIADAYVLARISEAVYRVRNGEKLLDEFHLEYQREVIWSILDPKGYKENSESKKKKPKSKSTKRRGKPAAADSHTHNTEQQFLF